MPSKYFLGMLSCLLLSSSAVAQQDPTIAPPAVSVEAYTTVRDTAKSDNTWSVSVQAKQLFESGLFDQIVTKVIGDDAKEIVVLMDRYQEVIGLDPRQDIDSIELVSSADLMKLLDFDEEQLVIEHLPKSVLHAKLKKRGNLEGLLLALPGYQVASKSAAGTMHKISTAMVISTEDFPALVNFDEQGNVTAGFNPDLVTQATNKKLAANQNARSPSDEVDLFGGPTELPPPQSPIARFVVNGGALKKVVDFPDWQQVKDYPYPVIHRALKKLSHVQADLSSESTGNMKLDATLTAASDEDASQIAQLLKASVGMLKVTLTENELELDPEVDMIKKLTDEITVQISGRDVKVTANIKDVNSVMMLLQSL